MRRQGGVALILVLWVITLLTVIAGNFSFSMRGEALIARNQLLAAQAREHADAGVQLAWYELMKPPTDPQRWKGDGVVHELMLGDAVVRVTILDEAGKIDLNTASDSLLSGLFKSVGLNDDASAALLDAVLDWRDADSLRRLHGAEEEDYLAAGKNYTPANAPFGTVDELRQVMGMNPELYRKLAPALTVYSKQAGVNTAIAPREVLLAIPGVSAELVKQYLQQRSDALAAGQQAPPFAFADTYAAVPGAAYSVRSEARMADGTTFVREAVARLGQDPRRPVMVLAWNEGEAAPPGQITGQ
jgi:general secretion pathway protein K